MALIRYMILLLLVSVLGLSSNSLADVPTTNNPRLEFSDTSGSVYGWPYKLYVTNGSLTNNNDGTMTLTTGGGGPINALDVVYNNVTYPNVSVALDHLLYQAPVISGFTNNIGTVEIGTTVTSTVLNWSYNKTMITASLNQGIGSISPSLLTYTQTATYTTNRTYTLTAGDGVNSTSANTTISFENKNYWGSSIHDSSTITDAQIIALNKGFTITRAKSFSVSPSAEYIVYSYPASFGAATFTVNGFLDTAFTLTTRNFVNASGATVSYNIYTSNDLLTGTYSVVVS